MYLDHFLAIIFSIILIGGLVLLFLKSIKKSKAVINETETKYQNMRTEIDAQTKQLANKFGLSVVPTNSNNLKQIQTAVLNRYKEAEREFLEKNAIRKTANSYSSLGLCGVSETKFFYNIQSNIDEIKEMQNIPHTYDEMLGFMSRDLSLSLDEARNNASHGALRCYNNIKQALHLYERALNNINVNFAAIDLDDIQYYKMDGSVHYVSEVSGGDVNLRGAIAGAVIAGGAGAVIGSRIGTGINTQTVEKDQRNIEFVYKKDTHLNYLKVDSTYKSGTIDALHALIPQKDAAVIALTK